MDERAQLRRLQSYQWANNSCFIDVGLELWFQSFLSWTAKEQALILYDSAMHNAPLYSIFLHFKQRAGWIISPGRPAVLPNSDGRSSASLTPSALKGKSRAVWYVDDDNLPRGMEILNQGQRTVRNTIMEWAVTGGAAGSFRVGPTSYGETRRLLEHAVRVSCYSDSWMLLAGRCKIT